MNVICCECGKIIIEGVISHNSENPELTFGMCWDCMKKIKINKVEWTNINPDNLFTEKNKNFNK